MVLAVLYYNLNAINVNVVATIVSNEICFILFLDAYMKMHTYSVWILIWIVFASLLATCSFIIIRAGGVFKNVEEKKVEVEHLMSIVRATFASL